MTPSASSGEIPVRAAPRAAPGQAGRAEATAALPAATLGPNPSGQECLDALGRWGRVQGLRISRVLQLAGLPSSSVGNLTLARRPKAETVARVRAIIAYEEAPEAPIPAPIEALLPKAAQERRGGSESVTEVQVHRPAPAPFDTAQGKLSISEEVVREAEAAARRRSAARRGFGEVVDAPPMPAPAGMQAALLTTPNDAMRALITGWPELWHRLVAESKAAGQLPGVYFAQAVERGLDALAGDA